MQTAEPRISEGELPYKEYEVQLLVSTNDSNILKRHIDALVYRVEEAL